MTPVEERIDHEEAGKKLRVIYARLNDSRGKSWPLAEGPFFSDVEWLCDQMRALLTEHSVYEEFIRRQGMRQAFSQWRPLLLPATEPAQREEEPNG